MTSLTAASLRQEKLHIHAYTSYNTDSLIDERYLKLEKHRSGSICLTPGAYLRSQGDEFQHFGLPNFLLGKEPYSGHDLGQLIT